MQHSVTDSLYPLYDARWEHDACGTGFIAQISGEASHDLVETALEALAHLTHRGAQDADADTGDGAGLMTQIPKTLLCEELLAHGIVIADPADLAVGMIFLPGEERFPAEHDACRRLIERTLQELGLPLLSWRDPPVNIDVLGARARASVPSIAQILLQRPRHLTLEQYERSLYHARRLIEKRLQQAQQRECYIPSLTSRTIVYKGLMAPLELSRFYLDLADPRYTSAFAIFHQRYSTNTFPSWSLARPMRLLAHNGEINTVQGNRHWMQAREGAMFSSHWLEKLADLLPVIPSAGSDSAQLDNVLELLTYSGRDLVLSMQMLIPLRGNKC